MGKTGRELCLPWILEQPVRIYGKEWDKILKIQLGFYQSKPYLKVQPVLKLAKRHNIGKRSDKSPFQCKTSINRHTSQGLVLPKNLHLAEKTFLFF
jgi:hypothetical protein